ncbi:hypothetical protein HO173_001923 [Letharia columbiana]|uniref:BTB domain-containing protein n=1 Tax=Letharia columbiana TaxID=112416 RepID=A0A8H6L928_9LECA|nr:uncharacterized protein HO173_001923 [Letharia columbiana]KAF6240312.1 hypothetical protein HO173_001923 [Letharia columbiana]
MAPYTADKYGPKTPKIFGHKPTMDAFDSIVLIKVGPGKQVFHIHKKLLCDNSTYFHAAINGSFKEAKDQSIEMPEDDPGVFRHFQYWTYTGNIVPEAQGAQEAKTIQWNILTSLYAFAEARDIPLLQNATIDLAILRLQAEHRMPVELLLDIYENTSENSRLRILFVDFAAHRGTIRKGWFGGRCPIEFLIDLAVAQHARTSGSVSDIANFWKSRANYHVEVPVALSNKDKSEQD